MDRFYRPLGSVMLIATFAADLSIPLGYAGGMLYILPVLLGLWAASNRYVIVTAAVATGLTVIGFFASARPETLPATVYLNRGAAMFAVWVTAFGIILYRRIATHLHTSNAELKHANATLQRSDERLLFSQSVAHIGSWEWTMTNTRLWCSEEIHRILGVSPASELSVSKLLARVLPADLPELQAAVVDLIQNAKPLSLNFRAVCADRSMRVIHATGHRDAGGDQPGRLVGTAQDITERKRLEDEFLLIQKTEAVGRLAGSIAHDFNNLLMGIRGCLTVALKRMPNDHPVRGSIEDVLAATEDGAQITRQLLNFCARHDDEEARVEVDVMLAQVREMLRRLVDEHIDFGVSLNAHGAWIGINKGRLQQVIMNLVVNARDAMPDAGTLTIRTTADNAHVELTVTDNGCGMSEQTKQRIFDPFFTTKGLDQGTGLGLATVHRIVAGCGGKISVDSRVGEGAVFVVQLPRVAPGETKQASWLSSPIDARGQTVLLVDDQRLVRMSVQHYLEAVGFRVLAAADADQALALLQEHGDVNVLLTDVVLPGMPGPALAAHVRTLVPGVHVLFMSAYSADMLIRNERVPKGSAMLQKPFTEPELLDVLRAQLAPPRDIRTSGSTNGRAILLVEDQPLSRKATAELLGDTGYEVLTAATGAEARARFAEHKSRIGLIITDIGLPDVDGTVLATQLRATSPDLPVVYTTGRCADDQRLRAALKAPASHFIQKPIDFDRLEALVTRLLRTP